MSDTTTRRRIRAQASAGDPDAMAFLLDADVQPGRSARLDADDDAPLARALFAMPGVVRVEVTGATIWARKAPAADWASLKPRIAGAIRDVLDAADAPLGEAAAGGAAGADGGLRAAVEALLEGQVNPSIAAHGGHISVARVEGDTVFLRMSGGCQGCAASAATLRQGVERMLRAALPQIGDIVDVTDHAAGRNPYFAKGGGPSPVLNRPLPETAIGWEDGRVTVDPDFLAPRLGLTPAALRDGLRSGDVVGVTEAGHGDDTGKTRVVLRSATRAWAAEIDADGAAREIPPPRPTEAAGVAENTLPGRVRAHLGALSPEQTPVTYGALARALGLWMPGAIAKVTRALETTMREDAAAGRPFIAARVAGRGRDGVPAPGFFDRARALSRGPRPGESEAQFHAQELARSHDPVADIASPAEEGPPPRA